MKKRTATIIMSMTIIVSSYFVGLSTPKETATASTPSRISVTECVPLCDIAGYFYDTNGYLCFELTDTTKQFNDVNGYSYSKICDCLPHLTDLEKGTYTTTAKVVKVKNHTLTLEDNKGNLWKFRSFDTFKKGDKVTMLMDSKGTKKVADDVILELQLM